LAKKSEVVSATGKPFEVLIESFKFKAFGSLLKRELLWFENKANERINAVLPLYELAKKISIDKDISEETALAIVKSLDDPQYENILFAYSSDLAKIQQNTYSETEFNSDIATMMIGSRVSVAALNDKAEELYSYYGISYNPETGWTADDTDGLPMGVIEEICEFALKEKDRLTVNSGVVSDEVVTLGK
jgi:hypothetical protein